MQKTLLQVEKHGADVPHEEFLAKANLRAQNGFSSCKIKKTVHSTIIPTKNKNTVIQQHGWSYKMDGESLTPAHNCRVQNEHLPPAIG